MGWEHSDQPSWNKIETWIQAPPSCLSGWWPWTRFPTSPSVYLPISQIPKARVPSPHGGCGDSGQQVKSQCSELIGQTSFSELHASGTPPGLSLCQDSRSLGSEQRKSRNTDHRPGVSTAYQRLAAERMMLQQQRQKQKVLDSGGAPAAWPDSKQKHSLKLIFRIQ